MFGGFKLCFFYFYDCFSIHMFQHDTFGNNSRLYDANKNTTPLLASAVYKIKFIIIKHGQS